MGRLDKKVAFITGAARGQGRSHALGLAREGASIIALDICNNVPSVQYDLATAEDLAETARRVEALDRRIVTIKADVRDAATVAARLSQAVAELGGLDIVVANAGVAALGVEESATAWQDTIDINLTGVFNTVEAAIPHLKKRGAGSIILISSVAGLRGILGPSHAGLGYTASKHGMVGLMRSYANNLAADSIRVNTIHPTGVETTMTTAPYIQGLAEKSPELANDFKNAMPVELLAPQDITNAVLFLGSDEARYITGVTLPVDGGFANKRF